MYLGVPDADPLPFGCYCNIEDERMDLLGTVAIWPTRITVGDA